MKVLELLRSFGKKDWHWFGKFLISPVFNQNPAMTQLYSYFRKNRNEIQDKNLSKNLSSFLFENEAADTAKKHHTVNYFLRVTEDYMAWDTWQSDESERMLCLLKACNQRGLDRPFHEVHERLLKMRSAQPERNPHHYRFQYLLARENYHHSTKTERSGIEQLQPLSDLHDIAFIAEKLKNACILRSWRKVLKTDFDTGLLAYVLTFVQERPHLLEYPAIAVYYYGYLAIGEPQVETHFFSLKSNLRSAGKQFPVSELRDIYMLAINFCINRINLRQDAYLRELLDLYQDGLSVGVFLENAQISKFTYTNIALLALRMREFEWTARFLDQYKDALPEAQRQGTYAFNLARYYCESGHFDRAMPLLQSMDFDDVLHNLIAKAMLIRMYYETGEMSALGSLLDSLDTYLRRKSQIGEQQNTAYRNTIRIVRKLIALKPGHAKARKALLEEVLNTALLAEKDWLVRVVQV